MNNLKLNQGFAVCSATECTPAGLDAVAGNMTFNVSGIVGSAVIIPPTPTPQQIDGWDASAHGGTSDNDTSLRTIVIVGALASDAMANLLNALSIGEWAARRVSPAAVPVIAGVVYIPDVSTGSVAVAYGNARVPIPSGCRVVSDVISMSRENTEGYTAADTLRSMAGRVGGGIPLAANECAAVIALAFRSWTGSNVDAATPYNDYASTRVTVYGGPVSVEAMAGLTVTQPATNVPGALDAVGYSASRSLSRAGNIVTPGSPR